MILNQKNFYIYCTIDFRWKDLEKRYIQELLNLTKINFLVNYFRKKLGCLTEYLIRLFWECMGYSLHIPVFSSFTRPEWLEKYHHCVRIFRNGTFFFSVFSRIRTKSGDLLRKSLYSSQIWENTDQKNFKFENFLQSFFHSEEYC